MYMYDTSFLVFMIVRNSVRAEAEEKFSDPDIAN
jgi:hypothetical protein